MMGIVESHIIHLHKMSFIIIPLPKLSYKTNTSSRMPIFTKTMNQIGSCVYIRYNENMYKKHATHKSFNLDNENRFKITPVFKNSFEQ